MVVHTYNPSTQEAEAGGSWIWGQSGLCSYVVHLSKKPNGQQQQQQKLDNFKVWTWPGNEFNPESRCGQLGLASLHTFLCDLDWVTFIALGSKSLSNMFNHLEEI
jgi:hypothetical protein